MTKQDNTVTSWNIQRAWQSKQCPFTNQTEEYRCLEWWGNNNKYLFM